MPVETFETFHYRYLCVSPFDHLDACVLRYRRARAGRNSWVRDRDWIVPRYRTYAEARGAAERFAAEDEG